MGVGLEVDFDFDFIKDMLPRDQKKGARRKCV